ncbi:FAD-binding oxidoreductase [Streptomyces sp. NPDC056188]|uniref:FAD-binding oxidoreductase n=1 Tax=Streptomyces sp. NPDC056188 TaxID=3345740 RepID=UPI0035DD8166
MCARFGAPVLSRGGGTSLAGQATNAAVVVDRTKYCHRLVSVDPGARTCVVEPGIVLDELNRQLSGHRLQFGPKPSTHTHCALGGMIGNNSRGASAQAYGKTVDNVRRLENLTYDGTRMWVGPTPKAERERIAEEGGRRAGIYAGLDRIITEYLADVRHGYPDIPRRVSGYNLDSLLPEKGFDVARALVGSEGTLVTVLRAELDLVPVPPLQSLLVLGYDDICTAADDVPRLLEHSDPSQLEAVDDQARELLWSLSRSEKDPAVALSDNPEREQEMLKAREAGLGVTARPPRTAGRPGRAGRTPPSRPTAWGTICAT